MSNRPNWFRDDEIHMGVDYADPARVEVYDRDHERFRDYEQSAQTALDRLRVGPDHVVIDMGAGTGAFTIYAARRCKKVYAVDVSRAMLTRCRQKVEAAGLDNVVYCHGGFLTYEHDSDPVDAVVSMAALHHLPDFWKMVALQRMRAMLKPDGRFFLYDIVFPEDMNDYETRFNTWMETLRETISPAFAIEAAIHVREEHSTFDWVMEGLLRRAGFRIESAEYDANYGAWYVCGIR